MEAGFSKLWYSKIHLIPKTLALGNLMSAQSRDVLIWNANFNPVNVLEIGAEVDEGVSLSGPTVLPYAMQPLQEVRYTVNATLIGPPNIVGSYTFNFGYTTLTLGITGSRVVVWPFSPQHGATESLEWVTDVMRTKAGEQRLALRNAPRQTFEYSYKMDESQVSRMRAMTVGWAQRQYGLPVWYEGTYIGTVLEGDVTVNVDTSTADYRVGGVAVLWVSDLNFEAVVLDAVSPTQLTLRLPLQRTMTGVFVMPVRSARTTEVKIARGSNQQASVRAEFKVVDNAYYGGSIGLPTFEGLDVLTDVRVNLGGYEERVVKEVHHFDNKMATPVLDSRYGQSDEHFSVTWDLSSKAQVWRVRKWLHSLKGRQKAFWLPSPTRDMVLIEPIDPSAGGITVGAFGASLFYQEKVIQILQKNGTRSYHRVLGASEAGANEVLSFSLPTGITVQVASDPQISYMYKVRLDTDRVEIRYESNSMITIKVPVKEVVS
jgi:hypothetical protein